MTTIERVKKKPGYKYLGIILLLIIVAYNIAHIEQQKQELRKAKQIDCTKCHNRKAAMTDYFRKAKNPTPEEMAVAVLKTKNARLLAAMATKGELNTHYKVRNGGFKHRYAGAWQVSKKDWGKVPNNPVEQALQAESILVELTRTMPIEKALASYGGDSTDKYANRVLAELQRVP